MNNKIIFGSVIGILFTATLLILTSALITALYSDYNVFSLLFLIVAIYVFFYAIVAGGVAGAVVTGFEFNATNAGLFGLLFNLFLGLILFLLTGGGWDKGMIYDYCASVIVGILNGILVSLFNSSQQTLK
jgi:hypothetical protein